MKRKNVTIKSEDLKLIDGKGWEKQIANIRKYTQHEALTTKTPEEWALLMFYRMDDWNSILAMVAYLINKRTPPATPFKQIVEE